MRLIDADALENQFGVSDEDLLALDEIRHAPTVDAAPVVRCKECMHYLIVDEFEGGKMYMCKVNQFSYINSDGDMHYCSYGERKEKPHDRLQKDL